MTGAEKKDIVLSMTCAENPARPPREQAQHSFSSRQDAILDAMPDIIMEVDKDQVYCWANQAGVAFFGDDVIGRNAACFFEGEQETIRRVEPVFRGSEKVVYVESWQRRKDGARRLLAWRCRVLKNGRGEVTGAISLASDITDQKQAEDERSRQLEELQRWQAVTLGREDRIMELKREVNALALRLKLPPPYASVGLETPGRNHLSLDSPDPSMRSAIT
jgi:PAS domain S-box-containing protein